MSRYSLRQTPRKKEPFDGMVETPTRRVSSKRQTSMSFEGSDADADSSSAAETATTSRAARALRRRGTAKFIEHLDDEDDASTPRAAEHSHGPNGQSSPENGLSQRKTASTATAAAASKEAPAAQPDKLIDGWKPGMDPKVDNSGKYEFGGTPGVTAMMIGFPLLMWYMWIGATYYDGGFPTRAPGQSFPEFLHHLASLVYEGAFPSLKAWAMYWSFFTFEMLLYIFAPGVYAYGKPLPFEGGKQLKYYCSGFCSLYITLGVFAALHFTGLYRASTVIDEFGPLLSVSICSGYLVAIIAYFSALYRGAQHRMSGSPIYDFFMGAELNPRMFGILDFKMFFEVRLPWYILLLLSISTAVRQYEQYGYVSGEVCFILMAHWLYANACAKGEELIVTTWDMYYEKWGFMLIFWNMSGVPLSYCHCTVYLATHDPAEYRWNRVFLTFLFAAYIFAYWVWDSCNGQKNSFRALERGTFTKRNTFPQVPWQSVKNPHKIQTQTGDAILVDGWYGLARKVHYTCDTFFAICWGLITGFSSPFPWFYPVFFVGMIAHRAYRDIERCREKYGEAWKEYERQVPYLFIPYVI
ncbi:ergosterol biosynthesis ERG4/ERG24 family-domain-containing protein [Coniella lustricola]|uniref:Delta(24(24(1)))-sterol reductase n=1 Tax=Coniella lustricola TaxID=2025994 RepID=A0A2T3A6Q8_9PEZI|nr:ergosterol biosynthesis ERG4/ERG24 family-domain-containing protein [Coniella lustricola]